MALGKTAIANLALIDIGAKTISAFDDGSNEANKVAALWDALREEVLSIHNWDFAKKTEILAQEADYDIDDEKWDYSYALPSDCIKPRYLSDKDYNYEVREKHLLCDLDDGDAILVYTVDVEDTTAWDVLFRQAFAKRLSAALCRPLKRKGSKVNDLMNEYFAMISTARMGDAAQSNQSNDDKYRHTAENDTWLTARTV